MSATSPARRKQGQPDQAYWRALWREADPDAPQLDRLIDRAVVEVEARGRRQAYAWSGGKDSLALQLVMDLAGVEECVIAITRLEHPRFLQWAGLHMPDGLTVLDQGYDFAWLRAHPRQLFPLTARDSMVWFRGCQHAGQRAYFHDHGLRYLALGRRRAEGNYPGPRGDGEYVDRSGCHRYCPLWDWTHVDVMAAMKRLGLDELPPFYEWPRGYQVGTHPWPGRQHCQSQEQGWRETWQIDPDVVREAAEERIPGAAEAVHRLGRA